MFSASGHMMVLIGIALGVLQLHPERDATPTPKKNVITVQLSPRKVSPAPLPPTTPVAKTIPPVSAALKSTRAIPAGGEASAKNTTAFPLPAPNLPPAISQPPATAPQPDSPSMPESGAQHPLEPVAPVPSGNTNDLPYYHSLKQLTERPKVIEDATTDMRLILPGIENQSVVLRLLINEAGAIDQVEVEHSNLRPEVEPIVVGAFNRLRFTPGKIDGVAVKCQLKIEVMLENANSAPLTR